MYFNPNMFNNRGCGCCGDTPCNPCVLPSCPPAPHCSPNIQPTPVWTAPRENVSTRQVAHEQPIITPIDNRTVTRHVFTPRYYVQNSFSQEDVIEANPFVTAPQAPAFPFGNVGMQTMNQMAQMNPIMSNENTNTAQFTNIINRNVF